MEAILNWANLWLIWVSEQMFPQVGQHAELFAELQNTPTEIGQRIVDSDSGCLDSGQSR